MAQPGAADPGSARVAGCGRAFGFFVHLIVGGYSGGSSPTSVAPMLFPVAFLFFLVVQIPATLVCALLWLGYRVASARGGDRVRLR